MKQTTEKLLKWAECLLSDIDAKAIQYEDGTTYDPNVTGDLVADIRAARELIKVEGKQQLFICTNEESDIMSMIKSLPADTFNTRLALLIQEHYSADNTTAVYKGENRNYEHEYTATIFEDGNEEREETITLTPVAEY